MALPNIGNPGGPPKKGDGDLANNSEGCPPPGEKEWTVKSIDFYKDPVKGTGGSPFTPTTPYIGPADMEIDLNDPRYQQEESSDPVAGRIFEAGKDTLVGLATEGEEKNVLKTRDTLGAAFYAVAQNPEVRESLDSAEQTLEESINDLANEYIGEWGGTPNSNVDLGQNGAYMSVTLGYKQPVWTKIINNNPEGGSSFSCSRWFLEGSARVHGSLGVDGKPNFEANAGVRGGITVDTPLGSFDVYAEGTVTHTGDFGTGVGVEVSLGGR